MGTLHEDEPHVDLDLVRALVDDQLPQWSSLALRELPATGTDHHLFRLGHELVVRVPRVDWATDQVERDGRWLPGLAPYVDVALPEQVAVGEPGRGYPWRWSVCRWIEGRTPDPGDPRDRAALAEPLGRFCLALRGIPAVEGPRAGVDVSRGGPLAQRHELTLEAISEVSDELHGPSLRAAWEESLAAGEHEGPGSWFHADLLAGNLLVGPGRDGRDTLVAVIDWGPSGIGDAAVDAAPAWSLLTAGEREQFRAAGEWDDASWLRGRGWALTTSLVALPYYRTRSHGLADLSRRTLIAVLADS